MRNLQDLFPVYPEGFFSLFSIIGNDFHHVIALTGQAGTKQDVFLSRKHNTTKKKI